jgi:tetratricopeptide (TPR) repeat protein
MKQLLICLVAMAALFSNAREFVPVDWTNIKQEATNHPQRIKDLVARLSADELDSTLTYPERILAFYGQSYLTQDKEELDVRTMQQHAKNKNFEECLACAKRILEINPLNIDALRQAGNAIYALSEDSVNCRGLTKDDAKPYFARAFRIYNTIATTGDGSAEHPFYVTKISDEYNFMRVYLNLWKFSSQALVGNCDVFTLSENSEYYLQPEIHFEITRVLEIEMMMFQ